MNSEEQVRNALRALADHDRGREAGPEVEERVMRGFQSAQRRSYRFVWPLAIAASIGLAVFVPRWVGSPDPAPAEIVRVVDAVPVLEPATELTSIQASAPLAVRTTARREIVTEFFLLTDSVLPLERGQLLRVRVPASMMYTVGLPMNPDRWQEQVDADVLMGEEGMARAIRFVGYQQQ